MSELLKPGIHFGVSRSEYESDTGINQSTLKDFSRAKTPYHFKYERDNPVEKDKDYLRIGTALDTLIWSPSEFKDRIVIAPATYPCEPTKKDPRTEKPWTLQSEWCKAWWEEALKKGKTPLMEKERKQVAGMLAGLERHPDVPGILENCERHVVIIAIHPTLGCRMKAELDLWPMTHSDALGQWYFELKTDGEGADDPTFHKKCWKIGYVRQIAYYLTLARYAGFDRIHSCGVIANESFPPYSTKVHEAHWDDEDVATERAWIDETLVKYMACVESGNWPEYPAGWSKIRYPRYAKRKGDFESEVLE